METSNLTIVKQQDFATNYSLQYYLGDYFKDAQFNKECKYTPLNNQKRENDNLNATINSKKDANAEKD